MGAKLIGVLPNFDRPSRVIVDSTEPHGPKSSYRRVEDAKPTKCLFIADDGSLKLVGVNAGVFPGWWSHKDASHRVFPPFPTGSWNLGQIRRLENGEVSFTKTLSIPWEGIENAWHPTKIDFTEFELVSHFEGTSSGRLWHAKHPLFEDKSLFVKIAPWTSNLFKRAMENETTVYQLVDGLGIAPVFLGHVTYGGVVIGFILEWMEGAKTSKRKDKSARLEAVKKLHALGITHGSAHRKNFLKIGENVIMIDFESSRFGEKAIDALKAMTHGVDKKTVDSVSDNYFDVLVKEDIRQISDVRGEMVTMIDEDDLPSEEDRFFDPLVDEGSDFNWTDDSELE